MLRGKKELNKAIHSLFDMLGYSEITCELSTEFAYHPITEKITYTLIEMPYNDIGFKEYLKETYSDCPECSMFVFSLLHELGHHLTLDDIEDSVYNKCWKQKERLEKKTPKTIKGKINLQKAYCKIYDEAIATETAVEILKNNYKKILEFEAIWFSAVMKFYNKNGLKNI